MNSTVNLKEFRNNVATYAKKIGRGDSFIVTKHSKQLFRISPVNEDGWETVVDFTKFRKAGIPASELLDVLKSL